MMGGIRKLRVQPFEKIRSEMKSILANG